MMLFFLGFLLVALRRFLFLRRQQAILPQDIKVLFFGHGTSR
jgi:hypothetical protein